MVLVSFMLQVFLLVFARIRRRNPSAALRILLWLAYLLADNVAVYALGHMSLNSRLHEDRLVAFWAPFFLLHLGGQDTITAYSLEDNQLWKRHLLTLFVQVTAAAYVLYLYIAGTRTLVPATILMLMVGVVKYGERVWALKCANIANLGTSLDIPEGEYGRLDRRGNLDAEEEVLLGAHYLFSLCRSEFVDRKPTVAAYKAAAAIKQGRQFNGGMYMYDLAEVELSLMYDFLYTKAPVIHTWHGCCIRVVSPLATVATFLLFRFGRKDAYSGVDVAITYVLLVGAVILEISSLLRALGSTWTCASLHARKWDRLHALVMFIRRLVKAGSNRRWLHSVGQHNLLDFCTRDKTKLRDRIAKAIGLGDWWNKLHYSSTIAISTEVKELVMTQIVKTMRDWSKWNIRYTRGRAALTDCGIFDDIGWSVDGRNLDECILVWHIATDIYLCCCNDKGRVNNGGAPLVKAIKLLSDYMGYLLLVRPYLVPGGVRRSLHRDNCPALEELWRKLSTGEVQVVHGSGHYTEEVADSSRHSIGDVDARSRMSTGEVEDVIRISTGQEEDRSRLSIGEREDRSTQTTGEEKDRIRISAGEEKDRIRISNGEEEDTSKQSTGEVEDNTRISIIEGEDRNNSVLPQSEKLAKFLLQRYSDNTYLTAYYRGAHLASKLLGNEWNLPDMLDLIFAVWVEFLCYTAENCTDVSHCKQLGSGGDFLTVIRLVLDHIELFGINR